MPVSATIWASGKKVQLIFGLPFVLPRPSGSIRPNLGKVGGVTRAGRRLLKSADSLHEVCRENSNLLKSILNNSIQTHHAERFPDDRMEEAGFVLHVLQLTFVIT